jgi:hypothetical protein
MGGAGVVHKVSPPACTHLPAKHPFNVMHPFQQVSQYVDAMGSALVLPPQGSAPTRYSPWLPCLSASRFADPLPPSFLPASCPASPQVLLPGDELAFTCTFDSTSRTNVTREGPGTRDEMCFHWIYYWPAVPGMG